MIHPARPNCWWRTGLHPARPQCKRWRNTPYRSSIQHVRSRKYRNAGQPEEHLVRHRHFSVILLCQSGIGIPASGSVRYRWSRNSPAWPIIVCLSASYKLSFKKTIVKIKITQHKIPMLKPHLPSKDAFHSSNTTLKHETN